jgi:hypothetical protein
VNARRVGLTACAVAALTVAASPLLIVAAWLYEAHEREDAMRVAASIARHPAGKAVGR